MAKRRRFTPEFKAELVFEVLSGESSQAEVCRCHNLNEINSHSGSDSCLKMRPPCLSPRISSPAMPRSVSLTLNSSLGGWPRR